MLKTRPIDSSDLQQLQESGVWLRSLEYGAGVSIQGSGFIRTSSDLHRSVLAGAFGVLEAWRLLHNRFCHFAATKTARPASEKQSFHDAESFPNFRTTFLNKPFPTSEIPSSKLAQENTPAASIFAQTCFPASSRPGV